MQQNNRFLKTITFSFIIMIGLYLWMVPQQLENTAEDAVWPHLQSEETVDPNVTWGVLPNGMRYALYPNHTPENHVSMRLLVEAGSMMEDEDQLGLAHFLEHMAFNGSDNFPPEELFKELERFGLAKGADSNASTSFWQTIYQLDVPVNEGNAVDLAMTIFKDFVMGISLDPEQIERERGVVLSEMRDSEGPSMRTFKAFQAFLLGEARMNDRFPIGTEQVLKTAQRDAFKRFYDQWYRPENTVLVVVGAFDVDDMTQQITRTFTAFKARATKDTMPEPKPWQRRALEAGYFHDPDLAQDLLAIMQTRPANEAPPSMAQLRQEMVEDLAYGMLNTRFQEMILAGEERFINASASQSDYEPYLKADMITLSFKNGDWQPALGAVEQEIRRAVQYGFSEQEFKRQLAETKNLFEVRVQTANTRDSAMLADQLTATIGSDNVFTHPADDLTLVTAFLSEISLAEVNEAMQAIWSHDPLIFMTAQTPVAETEEDAKAQIIATFKASQQQAVDPMVAEAEVAFAYDQTPPAGEIIERRHIEDLDITQVAFANGVKASLKITDFRENTLTLMAGFGNGQLGMDKAKPGLNFLAENMFVLGGLEKHSLNELERLFAGRSVGPGALQFSVAQDRFWLSGMTTNDEQAALAKLMRAWILEPGLRPEAKALIDKNLPAWYRQMETRPGGVYNLEIARIVHGNDPRFGAPSRNDLSARTLEEVRDWLLPQLQSSDLEVSVVGDFDMDAMIDLLAQTLGNLPVRGEKPTYKEGDLDIALPAAGEPRLFEHGGEANQALSYVYWPAPDRQEVHRSRVGAVLRSVLNNRLDQRLREDEAATYSPGTSLSQSHNVKDFGYFSAFFTTTPEDAKRMTMIAQEVAASLTSDPISADELERAKNPIIETLVKQQESNGYWLQRALSRAWSEPETLDYVRSLTDDMRSIQLAEVQQMAETYLTPTQSQVYIIYPSKWQEGDQGLPQ